ncbi:hypothetical protein AVEN_20349-1 [Araneus ventricosus]|uniref:Uncharacterized protein n=1 Tax=Araneus ventricosus TaxID=182803 RepID=A0A4Y2MP59_ARAVE|nr:hypothetical protein AVEN_20349-1 [Araneus ventricosus]
MDAVSVTMVTDRVVASFRVKGEFRNTGCDILRLTTVLPPPQNTGHGAQPHGILLCLTWLLDEASKLSRPSKRKGGNGNLLDFGELYTQKELDIEIKIKFSVVLRFCHSL